MEKNELKIGDEVYLIKYCLSSGVIKLNIIDVYRNSLSCRLEGYGWNSYRLGKDFFTDKDAALEAANKMRVKKLAGLEKQIKKLSAPFTKVKGE